MENKHKELISFPDWAHYVVKEKSLDDGHQVVFKFDNGYGASVIRTRFSYGGSDGLFELAILKFLDGDNYTLGYDTDIQTEDDNGDLYGHLEVEEVLSLLARIRELKVTQIAHEGGNAILTPIAPCADHIECTFRVLKPGESFGD